jgi:hypothetical protein
MLTLGTIKEANTHVGIAKYGRPIGLDEKMKVDLGYVSPATYVDSVVQMSS